MEAAKVPRSEENADWFRSMVTNSVSDKYQMCIFGGCFGTWENLLLGLQVGSHVGPPELMVSFLLHGIPPADDGIRTDEQMMGATSNFEDH
jgi:hypothetical protein